MPKSHRNSESNGTCRDLSKSKDFEICFLPFNHKSCNLFNNFIKKTQSIGLKMSVYHLDTRILKIINTEEDSFFFFFQTKFLSLKWLVDVGKVKTCVQKMHLQT